VASFLVSPPQAPICKNSPQETDFLLLFSYKYMIRRPSIFNYKQHPDGCMQSTVMIISCEYTRPLFALPTGTLSRHLLRANHASVTRAWNRRHDTVETTIVKQRWFVAIRIPVKPKPRSVTCNKSVSVWRAGLLKPHPSRMSLRPCPIQSPRWIVGTGNVDV
jgi:hypothetical protein